VLARQEGELIPDENEPELIPPEPITYNSWLQPGGSNRSVGHLSVLLSVSVESGEVTSVSFPRSRPLPVCGLHRVSTSAKMNRNRGGRGLWPVGLRTMERVALRICAFFLGRPETADLSGTEAPEDSERGS